MNNSVRLTRIWPRNVAQGRQDSFVLPKQSQSPVHENCHLEYELKVSPPSLSVVSGRSWCGRSNCRSTEIFRHGVWLHVGGKFEDRIDEQMYKCTIAGQQKGSAQRTRGCRELRRVRRDRRMSSAGPDPLGPGVAEMTTGYPAPHPLR